MRLWTRISGRKDSLTLFSYQDIVHSAKTTLSNALKVYRAAGVSIRLVYINDSQANNSPDFHCGEKAAMVVDQLWGCGS